LKAGVYAGAALDGAVKGEAASGLSPELIAALPGPGSVTWKVNRERATLLGWPAAVLMQLAHPLVAAGVGGHSVYVASPARRVERFRSTIQSMLSLTFGSPEAVRETVGRIMGIHEHVRGTLAQEVGPFPAGTPYAAGDPALLLWVHATLVATLPRAYETFVGPLNAEERRRGYLESAAPGRLFDIPAEALPTTEAALEAYLAAQYASGVIHVSDTARALAKDVLSPNTLLDTGARPLLARAASVASLPFAVLVRLTTTALLPPFVREQYGLPWTPRHAAALRGAAALIRRSLMLTPPVLRYWPASRAGSRTLSKYP
jgi:uncharacterized protein (DUF2236 family)